MADTIDQRQRFDDKLDMLDSNKGSNGRIMKMEQINESIERLKKIENNSHGKTDLLRIEVNGIIVEKMVRKGTNLRFVSKEEMFETIHESTYWSTMVAGTLCKIKYANIPLELINIY